VPTTVSGPRGEPVPAAVLLITQDDGSVTAFVEAGQACGPQLLPGGASDPVRATSEGVGELVRAAVDAGARQVVVGVGDTASHDGGAGLLGALGAGDRARLTCGGGELAGLDATALEGLAAARERLRGVELVVATASDLPLLGFHGASATDAERRGAEPAQAQALESALGHFADIAQRSSVAGRPLVGSGLAGTAGAGAGGGIGFALLLLGARRVDGVRAVLDATGFTSLLRHHDLVVTGEALFGADSLRRGAVVAQVAQEALTVGLPSVVLAVEVEVGRREALNAGVCGAYAVADRPSGLADVRHDPAGALADRARRVARTWSH
jgi:glycerate 2-kinase